jgi:hypothetical protein
MRRGTEVIVAAAICAVGARGAAAKPAYKSALESYLGPQLRAGTVSCETCHAGPEPGEPKFNLDLPRPHNAFGARLLALGKELAAARKGSDLPDRLDAAAQEDTDGDGTVNLTELLLGHRPGFRGDRPTPRELKTAPALLAQHAKLRAAYAWKPFEPVRRPTVPRPRDVAWLRNPIDAFVAVEREARGLQPRPEAPRETLLRRVYLDLTGVPPTREELHGFLADRSPTAYERVVDRLLAGPRYGERWARHWMDVWRYSDWDGYQSEIRNSQPHIWRWRDWIVGSLNQDRGYDRMVQEMLAADELAPGNPEALPATGFLARNWYKFNRNEVLTKVVEHTGKAFLGVTMNCARCHDHKFDAISMDEYFRFRSVFEAHDVRVDRIPGEPDTGKNGLARVFDANPRAETVFLIQGDEQKPDKSHPVGAPAVPALFGGPALQVAPIRLPRAEYAPDSREFVVAEATAAADAAVAGARNALDALREKPALPDEIELGELRVQAAEARRTALHATLLVERIEAGGGKDSAEWKTAATAATRAQRQSALSEATAALDGARQEEARAFQVKIRPVVAGNETPAAAARRAAAALDAAVKKRAEAEKVRAEAEKNVAQPDGTAYTPRIGATYPAESSGRRLALARWITDPRNPLAARVAINHMWLRHFGAALVPSVFDFGRNGRPASHPALLDWLAAELMTPAGEPRVPELGQWSMKRLHRLMVTSRTYRMDSTSDPVGLARDPENRYLWRMNSRRMEAEAVRDSVLHAAGQLDFTGGGPDLDPALGQTRPRRSLYFRHSVEKQVEFLATFDQANVSECYQRSESIVPQQALALANSELALAQSRRLAASLWRDASARANPSGPATGEFITAAFEQVLSRAPSAAERTECERFLREQAARLSVTSGLTAMTARSPNPVPPAVEAAQRARESLVHVLFNHNEFITIR